MSGSPRSPARCTVARVCAVTSSVPWNTRSSSVSCFAGIRRRILRRKRGDERERQTAPHRGHLSTACYRIFSNGCLSRSRRSRPSRAVLRGARRGSRREGGATGPASRRAASFAASRGWAACGAACARGSARCWPKPSANAGWRAGGGPAEQKPGVDGARQGPHHALGRREHRGAAAAVAPPRARPTPASSIPTTSRRRARPACFGRSSRRDFEKHRFWLIIDTPRVHRLRVALLRPGTERRRLLLRLPSRRPLSLDARRASGIVGGDVAHRTQRAARRASSRDRPRPGGARTARARGRAPPAARASGELLRADRRAAVV